MKKNENHLIVFLKYPEVGKVKTRLARDIGYEKALDIYKQLVTKVLENVISEDYAISIYFTPDHKSEEVNNFVKLDNIDYQPQSGKDLGLRMLNAFKNSNSSDYKKTVIIGTDCLEINNDLVNKSFNLLNNHDLVIGPATDGGYYLIGLKKLFDPLFKNIVWSTDRVLNQTLKIAKQSDISYMLLDFRTDIDANEDLNSYKYLII